MAEEGEFFAVPPHVNVFVDFDVSAKQFLGQRIFQIALDSAAHRTRAVLRVVTLLDQEVFGLLVEDEMDVFALRRCMTLLISRSRI